MQTTPALSRSAARLVEIGDRIPIMTGPFPMRLDSLAGLAPKGWTIATVTGIEHGPITMISTDRHDRALAFLANKLVTILSRR